MMYYLNMLLRKLFHCLNYKVLQVDMLPHMLLSLDQGL